MKKVVYFLERFQRRSLLLAVAILLVLANSGQWAVDVYESGREELESKNAKLAQFQLVTEKADVFKKRLAFLTREKEQVGQFLFSGEEDKLSSSMQLRLQAMVSKAGMQAESIRATLQKPERRQNKEDEEGQTFGEVLIKLKLAGTLHEFMDFMAGLYKGQEFFRVESISIRPYRTTGLKIALELKGYYIQTGQDGTSGETEK